MTFAIFAVSCSVLFILGVFFGVMLSLRKLDKAHGALWEINQVGNLHGVDKGEGMQAVRNVIEEFYTT